MDASEANLHNEADGFILQLLDTDKTDSDEAKSKVDSFKIVSTGPNFGCTPYKEKSVKHEVDKVP